MKANELMLGDWVYGLYPDGSRYNSPFRISAVDTYPSNKSPRIVTEGGYGFQEEHLAPIPLTPEILEKNGFDGAYKKTYQIYKSKGYDKLYISYWRGRLSIITSPDIRKYHSTNRIGVDCKFVHELQHALRLCGIEKEMEL